MRAFAFTRDHVWLTLSAVGAVLAAAILGALLAAHVFAAPMTLAQYLASWEAGPVKVSVPHYEVGEGRGVQVNANWGFADLRISIRNLTPKPLDLSAAYAHLVLVVDQPFPSGSGLPDESAPVPGVAADLHLYYVAFDNTTWQLEDSQGKEHTIGWLAGSLAPNGTYTSSNPAGNTALYVIPPPTAGGSVHVNEIDVSPARLHILGVGWLESGGQMIGFCPVSAWQGSNARSSALAS